MAYDYVLTKHAENDIDATYEYISETLLNPEAASELADEIAEQIREICKHPLTGRIVENDFLKRNDIRRFQVKNYIAYYFIDEEKETVVILRFVYGGRDQNNVVEKL